MYTGPSPRSLGLSLILHVGTVAALFNVPVPAPAPPLVATDPSKPTEIRIAGKLYYVAQIQGSQEAAQPNLRRNAPVAAATGRAAPRRLPLLAAPNLAVASQAAPMPATPALAPLPEPVRVMRQQARAFIPPQLKTNPTATQTLIQPLSPLDVTPPPTPLPNFRITADVSQVRRIPKPFVAPGRVTPPTPPQSPNVETPAMELVPSVQMPPGEPITILSLSDRPIPFSDKVVVPAGNVAQPPLPATSDGPGNSAGTATAASGGTPNGTPGAAPGANANGAANPRAPGGGGSPGGSPNGSPAAGGPASGSSAGTSTTASAATSPGGSGRGAAGNGNGAAITGGGKSGDTVVIVGGAGGSGGPPSNLPGSPGGAGTGNGGAGAVNTPGATVINRPPTGSFDAMVVQTSPIDQYPESRGLLSGRPVYSVYIPVGGGRDWTLFFCVPGEKPETAGGGIVTVATMGAPVKAPYPTKLIKPAVTLPRWERYVLIHGVVNKDGHFENLRIVRSAKYDLDQTLLAALNAWEFRAATRDGVSIAVEFLLSIPAKGL